MQTDTVSVLTADEYIFGVVAAEMPALYEPEALKAQAVAAYTLACRRRADNNCLLYTSEGENLKYIKFYSPAVSNVYLHFYQQ